MKLSLSRALSAVFLLVLAHAPVTAQTLTTCDDRIDEVSKLAGLPDSQALRAQWAKHRLLVRRAEPGTALYAPHPFPKSDKEIEEDFRYAYFEKLFDGGRDTLGKGELSIYDGLRAGTVEIRIARVENWRLSRCSPNRNVPFFHLIRLFDASGRELARGSILPTGLLGRYVQVSAIGAAAVPHLDVISERVEKMLGRPLKVKQARYATIDGLPLHCGPLVPCVVFEAGKSSYVLDRSALLYEISTDARRVSVTDRRAEIAAAGLQPLGRVIEERTLVTRGFEWLEARLIARDDESAAAQGLPSPKR